MTFADAAGIKLHAESTGAGIPIVFVHEFAGDARSWDEQVRFFSRRGFRCVTFDARGYPPSDVPDDVEHYGQAFAVADIAAVMRHFDITDAHVVGLSMGGYATLNFGLAHPTMARSLVVCGAGYGSDDDSRAAFLATSADLADRLDRLGMAEGIAEYAQGPTRQRFAEKDPRGFARFNRQFAEHSARGSALTMRGYQMKRPTIYSLESGLRALDVPTLIVTGDDDDPCLAPALFMKRTIPDARLWVMPRTGHPVNLEEPEDFNRTVFEFVSEMERRRGR